MIFTIYFISFKTVSISYNRTVCSTAACWKLVGKSLLYLLTGWKVELKSELSDHELFLKSSQIKNWSLLNNKYYKWHHTELCQSTDGKWSLACAEVSAFKTSVFDEKFVFDFLGCAKWGICSVSSAVLWNLITREDRQISAVYVFYQWNCCTLKFT